MWHLPVPGYRDADGASVSVEITGSIGHTGQQIPSDAAGEAKPMQTFHKPGKDIVHNVFRQRRIIEQRNG